MALSNAERRNFTLAFGKKGRTIQGRARVRHVQSNSARSDMTEIKISSPAYCNNLLQSIAQHVLISKIKYFKILATCFSYNEPSSGQKQNKVPVHSRVHDH